MKSVHSGDNGLLASSIGFGCARLGGVFQDATGESMIAALNEAFDNGINFYDTADIYCQGESEELLGRAFRGRRDKVIIASKAGYCLPAQRRLAARVKPLLKPFVKRLGLKRTSIPAGVRGALTQDFSPEYLVRACEQSLKRLGTDYLDLFQLHSPPADVLERGDFLEPLERLKRQGKIRSYGISCEQAIDARICLRYPGIAAIQLRLNVLERSPYDEILVQARAQGVAVIARECFAGGLLTRPVNALGLEDLIPNPVERSALEVEINRIAQLARESGRTLPELALQFVMGLPAVSVALLGMRTKAHVAANRRLAHLPRITDQEMRGLHSKLVASLST